MNDTNIALIFAGGTGSRMEGSRIPKQFLELGGKPIIAHTIEHFNNHSDIDLIVVVCLESWLTAMKDIVKKYHFEKVHSIIPGGSTGQDSIFRGLNVINDTIEDSNDAVVLIHDGVRPLINSDTISSCIESVRRFGCTATVAPSPETIIEVKDGKATNVLDRSICKFARAPQGFKFNDIYKTHLKANFDGRNQFIDSISMMASYGYPIFTVDGPVDNIKITSRKDFFAFKGYMDYKEMEQLW